jgi:Osmosensitive K+ channel histidine kinase
MFHKLHIQLTLFCTFVTGCIFLVLTFLCLLFAENNLKAEDNAAFLRQLNVALIHLQDQDLVSHQWLNQIQKNSQFLLYLYDNGKPLYYQQYHDSVQEKLLREEAVRQAAEEQNLDIFSEQPDRVILHTEFDFQSSDGRKYYASAGVIPKQSSHLGYLILSPLQGQQDRISRLRLVILLTDLIAIALLLVFSWFFTKRMILPLERSRERQIRFIASASHELRAPLAVLRSGLETLKKTSDPGEQDHFIGLMTEESSRMQNLIRDMLFLANADSSHFPIKKEICQPDELLLDSYEKFEPLAAGKKICLSLELPAGITKFPDLLCDRERIIQVFSILLDNALSYTPENGKIRLSLQVKPDFLVFVFTDSGCGVPDDEKQRIFDRFYRSDSAHAGRNHFGLGLCIAGEIVKAHHGSIWVEDAPEGGSCFFVKLVHSNGTSDNESVTF